MAIPVSSTARIDPMDGEGFEIKFGKEKLVQIYINEGDTADDVACELQRAIE